jgi:hypothetical protein
MATEEEWVASLLQPRLAAEFKEFDDGEYRIAVASGKRLTYANEILRYRNDVPDESNCAAYETDILVYDERQNIDWIPRVVLECKKGGVTTHDALTYSTKAATHKHVHPYLRYGILIGELGSTLPGRLIRHGAYFDFMMVWEGAEPTKEEFSKLVNVLKEEVRASRTMQELLSDARKRNRRKFSLLHRPLRLEP